MADTLFHMILAMRVHQERFLDAAVRCDALRFGQFTLKSGRQSPYFFNAGQLDTGSALAALGEAYAQAAVAADIDFDMLFGPAYKGIALAALTCAALARDHQRDCGFAYNRKEGKQHGEGGLLVGAPLRGRVLIVDDVITAGTAVREAVATIHAAGATVAGVLVALDRQERGTGEQSAAQEITAQLDVPVIAIATLDDLLSFTQGHATLGPYTDALQDYRRQYGV